MKLEDFKKVWDAQNNEYVFGINEEEMQKRVARKSMETGLMVNVFEWFMMALLALLMTFYVISGLTHYNLVQIPEGILFGILAVYLWRDRQKRLSIEKVKGESVIGQLERSISALQHHIRRQRRFFWWFILPVGLISVVDLVPNAAQVPWWVWMIVFLAYLFSYSLTRLELHKKLEPKLENLKGLRTLLSE